MKKIITLAFGIISLITAAAQGKTTIGIRAGYNFYTIHGRYANGENFWLKTEDGTHVGADVEIPIGKNLYLQPGILYNQKGANFDNYFLVWKEYHGDVKLSYIEFPLNFVFKPEMGSGHFILGAGGFIGKGIGREAGVDEGMVAVKFKRDIDSADLYKTPFIYRPLDAGANFMAGYQFANNLFLQANGQVGLKRINPPIEGRWDGKTKHRTIGVSMSIGYRF
jgi:hypothetical protein